MLIDLDGFKTVNDAYGQSAGDELLRSVAAVCRDEVRSFDLLARYDGDELAASARSRKAANADPGPWSDAVLRGSAPRPAACPTCRERHLWE